MSGGEGVRGVENGTVLQPPQRKALGLTVCRRVDAGAGVGCLWGVWAMEEW